MYKSKFLCSLAWENSEYNGRTRNTIWAMTKQLTKQIFFLSFIQVPPDPCDLVAPIQWATDQKKDVDVFIIVTDANRSTGSRNLGEAIAQYRKDRNLPNTK